MKHVWTIIGTLAAVASVVVALYIYSDQQEKTKKSLDVEEQYESELLRTKDIPKKLQISYDGEPIDNFVILGLRVHNRGSVPIEPKDYAEPILITLKGIKKIISAEIKNADPSGLDVDTQIVNNSIELEKELLNPTDSYIIEIGAIPEQNEKIEVDKIGGRISGIKEIRYRSRQFDVDDEYSRPWWFRLVYLVLLIQIILILFAFIRIRGIRKRQVPEIRVMLVAGSKELSEKQTLRKHQKIAIANGDLAGGAVPAEGLEVKQAASITYLGRKRFRVSADEATLIYDSAEKPSIEIGLDEPFDLKDDSGHKLGGIMISTSGVQDDPFGAGSDDGPF
ncbi:hypothetical protein [Candidatus Thiosymbion oneisti]|uniref:hypothetical protein n=1 Tax=Candidatus Thiosymbion oneisti TaxID=589554 RepID=UPI001061D1A0|nr:hypothetical protein [Candidatus Thiosymbion oneisti]